MAYISKSKYLSGLQCSKLLWYQYNAKESFPAPDEATQAIFDQGHEVGDLAKSLFPGGIEVAKGVVDIELVLSESVMVANKRKPLFEAAFSHKNAFARADVLKPVGRNQWDLFEVKSSTQVKEINLHDLAFQKYTYDGAGLRIRSCFLMHIDNQYVREGRVDPSKLFAQEDVTEQVLGLVPEIEGKVRQMEDVIALRKHPAIVIGPHCSEPYECPLHDLCWAFLPDQNIFTLYKGGEKSFELFRLGVERVVDIPSDFRLVGNQKIQREALKSGRPHVDRPALVAFLKSLEYPLYYLDFETFGTAIPLFDHVRPYQQIPFQFSLHVVEKEGGAATHHSYLGDGLKDPRPEILSRLQNLLGGKGSIICYNASFERSRISESCETYPMYSSWWSNTMPRMVDLLAPFRAFHYYHPQQRGSASIKAVLPALTGKGYEEMPISDGGTASREYLRVTFAEVSPADRRKVRKQLEEYCGLDTSGMMDIVEALRTNVAVT
jgi:hypothetical protein